MHTPAPTDTLPAAGAPCIPGELLVCIAEHLLQSRQYAAFAKLLRLNRYSKEMLSLLHKRFEVVMEHEVERLGMLALEPGTQHVQ